MKSPFGTELKFVPTAEAAFIAEVSDRDMNRVVDERMLPESLVRTDGGRFFTPIAAALAHFYFSTEDIYVARLRLRVLGELAARMATCNDQAAVLNLDRPCLDFNWRVAVAAGSMEVLVDASAAVHASLDRVRQIREARALVSIDPEVMGGMAVFVGTRVPVENIAASLDKGIDKQRLVDSWPYLTDKHFEAAKVYMRVHPRRGRSRRLSELNPDWKIVSSGVVRPHSHGVTL